MRKMLLSLSAGLGLVLAFSVPAAVTSPAAASSISKLGVIADVVDENRRQNIWLAHSPRHTQHRRRHLHGKKKTTRHSARRHNYGHTNSRRYSRHDLRIDLYDYWDIFTSGMGR